MSSFIRSLDALEILDSRGFPTIRATVHLDNGCRGTASAPAGASTGRHEVAELRDGDPGRYGGKGVARAVDLIRGSLNDLLSGIDAENQPSVDEALLDFFGRDEFATTGGNVMSAVSMAAACAAAASSRLPLYRYLGGANARRLPVPMMNVINGGKHADNSLDFQEFMIVPHGAARFSEALRYGAETFHALKSILHARGFSTSVGDEGGFAPDLSGNEQACELITKAIEKAGLRPGSDVALALDPAASSFYADGRYVLEKSGGGVLSAVDLQAYYQRLVDVYPIVSIEDGFAEDDWDGFRLQMEALGDRIQVVGDDLYTTDSNLIRRGITQQTSNAVLIKINQIGTLTGTRNAIDTCRDGRLRFIVSHRSGETEDTFIADFTVAMGGGQIKTGSLSRSERIAKYNRLLEIEYELGVSAVFHSPFARRESVEGTDAILSEYETTSSLQRSGHAKVHERALDRAREQSSDHVELNSDKGK